MKKTNRIHGARKQPRKHVYVYHWDRIIGAVVIFLVLGGLAGYGLSLWSDTSPKEDNMEEPLPMEAATVEKTRPKLEEETIHLEIVEDPLSFSHAEEEAPPAVTEIIESISKSHDTQTPLLHEAITAEDNPAQQFVENNPLEIEPSAPEMAQLSTTHDAGKETVEEAVVNEIDLEDSDPGKIAQSSGEMPVIPRQEKLTEPKAEISQNIPLEPQGESPESADTKPTFDTLNGPFQLKKLKILDPSVKRFLLTGSISNREPVGELNEISFSSDRNATVWAYSEVIDKKGSRFKYVWLHRGNQVATIPVNVGSNRWRSYSSKLIKQSMSGAWRVELQDSEGRLLARADFFLQ